MKLGELIQNIWVVHMSKRNPADIFRLGALYLWVNREIFTEKRDFGTQRRNWH